MDDETLLPAYTAHCFWLSCPHTETSLTPGQTHAAMEAHYTARHAADLDALLPPLGADRG